MVLITVTKYAKKILEIVEQSRSHMTAEQIFMELRRTYPTVVLATVYNNLNRLWQDDLIRKVSVEGTPDRYDRIQRHDHLVCRGVRQAAGRGPGRFDRPAGTEGGHRHPLL